MTDDRAGAEKDRPIVLKVLLQQRHLHTHSAFRREYDRVALRLDKDLKGSAPSKAQFYRWLSGDLARLPYSDHCRVLESMFPDWTVQQLFEEHAGGIGFIPEPPTPVRQATTLLASPPVDEERPRGVPGELVALYPHRSDTPKSLWLDLLSGASESIDLFANASLFLPEDNPTAIEILKKKARSGVKIRILLGDPDTEAMVLRGKEERLFDAIPGRIKMALAYYRPLVGIEGIEFRLHATSLYNSIFRYDDQMLVNQHIYGTYGYIAPILHLRKVAGADFFDTYMKSFELVWNEEAYGIDQAEAKNG
ncbi:hypothetical protein AB5J62_14110 [Amycolatopsis sp. cg5]|uniref:hypothetical protein n=1 Tax=Amycolatopsis sp. cg5 TaxID=3238802 RepID=UPI00352441B1